MGRKFSISLVKVRSKNARNYRWIPTKRAKSYRNPPNLRFTSGSKKKLRSAYAISVK